MYTNIFFYFEVYFIINLVWMKGKRKKSIVALAGSEAIYTLVSCLSELNTDDFSQITLKNY